MRTEILSTWIRSKRPEEFDEMSKQVTVSSLGFQLLLLGKDGGVKLRSSNVSLEDIFSLIDTMPMIRKEMRDDQC